MNVLILKTSSLYKFTLLLFALTLTVCEDSSNNSDGGTDVPPDGSSVEAEITPEAGDLYIVDEKII